MSGIHDWNGNTHSGPGIALGLVTGGVGAAGTGSSPVLAAAASDRDRCVVRPDQIGDFLRAHAHVHLGCYNAPGLHWALHEHLQRASDAHALQVLWDFSRTYLLHDVRLLDQLVQMAEDGARHPRRRTPQELAVAYGHPAQSPTAPNQNPRLAAVQEAQVVRSILATLEQRLSEFVPARSGASSPTAGPLALGLQVKGAIAIAQQATGRLHTTRADVDRILHTCHLVRERSAKVLLANQEARRCFKLAHGQVRFGADGLPDVKRKTLQVWLESVLDSMRGLHRTALDRPLGEDGWLSLDPRDWGILTRCHQLLSAWCDLVEASRLAHTFVTLAPDGWHPAYEILPRVRSLRPDLDQIRRLGLRDLFQPSADHVFVVIKLRDLELRALATVCERRFNRSALAGVFRRQLDPIAEAAVALTKTAGPQEPGRTALEWEQLARALLIAAPAGTGEAGMQAVARGEFGMDVGLADAMALHAQLVEQVYGELALYLADDTMEILADNLGSTPFDIEDAMVVWGVGRWKPVDLRERLLKPRKVSGPADEGLWRVLERCMANEALRPLLARKEFDHDLYRVLFGQRRTGMTGRARGRMLFSGARAAEYQDLADDAVKAALYAVTAAGFQVAGFAENEIVLEVPLASADGDALERAESQVTGAVEEVLGCVPAPCAGEPRSRW